jgi:IS5 family transposase
MSAWSCTTTSSRATPPTHPIGARGQAVSKRAGRPPRTVTADRGYGEKSIVDDLHDLGVRDVVVPHKGQPSAANNIGRRSDEPFHGAPGA